jgi:hypothetical protein
LGRTARQRYGAERPSGMVLTTDLNLPGDGTVEGADGGGVSKRDRI